ncbi:MAG: hypothetical protein ACRDNY_12165 [Gaiellaceae bacterium]
MGFAASLWVCALLALAGLDFPPGGFPFLIPFAAGLAVTWIVGRAVEVRAVTITESNGRRLFIFEAGHRVERLWLDELATVSRGGQDEPQALLLTDLRGTTLTVPLGVWTNEERLLAEVADAVRRSGAKGSVGDPIPVAKVSR